MRFSKRITSPETPLHRESRNLDWDTRLIGVGAKAARDLAWNDFSVDVSYHVRFSASFFLHPQLASR